VVTFEDQQKINKFARINAKLQDLKGDLEGKRVRSNIPSHDIKKVTRNLLQTINPFTFRYYTKECIVLVWLNLDEQNNWKNWTRIDLLKIV